MMKTALTAATLSAAFVVSVHTTSADAQPFDQVVSFGDSLSDTGNLSTRTFIDSARIITVPFSPPYFATLDNPGQPVGLTNPPRVRFSNGPVWTERLASNLGLSHTSYAFGGSRIGTGPASDFDLGAATGLPANLVVTDSLTKQVADYLGAGPATGSTAYTFLSGANDFAANLDFLTTDPNADPNVFVGGLVTHLAGSIAQVAAAESINNNGEDIFIVGNLPDLSKTPLVNDNLDLVPGLDPADEPAFLAGVSQLVDGFNTALAGALFGPGGVAEQTGANIQLLDLHALFDQATDPTNPFGLLNQTDPFYVSVTGLANFTGVQTDPAADPATDLDRYLFFDAQHPTAGLHAVLGDAATTLVPEPTALSIVFLGGLMVTARRRRR